MENIQAYTDKPNRNQTKKRLSVLFVMLLVLIVAGISGYFLTKNSCGFQLGLGVVPTPTKKPIRPELSESFKKAMITPLPVKYNSKEEKIANFTAVLKKASIGVEPEKFTKFDGVTGVFPNSLYYKGILRSISKDAIEVETWEGSYVFKLRRGDSAETTTALMIRENFNTNEGSFMSLDALNKESAHQAVVVMVNAKTGEAYQIELFKSND